MVREKGGEMLCSSVVYVLLLCAATSLKMQYVKHLMATQ